MTGLVHFPYTERMRSESQKEDLAKTISFIQAREYSFTITALKNSEDISFSMVYKIINTDNYQKNYDEYDEQMKKWTFSFCGSTPEGDDLQIIVCADTDHASIIHVKRLKKASSTPDEIGYIPNYNKVCKWISKEKFTYTKHAIERMEKRKLTQTRVEDVLRKGIHEASRDRLWKGRWTFAFRDKNIRVCVCNKMNHASITTAMTVCKRDVSYTLQPSQMAPDKPEELSFDDLLQLRTSKTTSSRKRKSTSSETSQVTPQKKLHSDSQYYAEAR